MRIWDWDRDKEFTQHLEQAVLMFNHFFNKIPKEGYWAEDRDDYSNFSEFLDKSIEQAVDEVESGKGFTGKHLFIFCNHDGETDEEVLQAFKDFAKCLSLFSYEVLILISSDIDDEDKNIFYLVNHEKGFCRYEGTNGNIEEEMKEYSAKEEILQAKERIKEAEATLLELEKKQGDTKCNAQ
jgi:hypothetical protein